MASVVVHRHPAAPGMHFKPVLPIRRNPDDLVKLPAVADDLGIARRDARQLVGTGALPADRNERGDVVVRGADLRAFARRLEPVTLVEAGARPASPPRAPGRPGPVGARRPVGAALVDEDADRDEDEASAGEDAQADCPNCGEPLELGPGVLKIRCPGCGHRLEVVEDDDADDQGADGNEQPARRSRFGFLGGRDR